MNQKAQRGPPGINAPHLHAAPLTETYSKIKQGLFWALVYNAVGMPAVALGLLAPVLAGAAMALSSVSVVLNALRLRRWQHDNHEVAA